mgnify:CR=1 FL=1
MDSVGSQTLDLESKIDTLEKSASFHAGTTSFLESQLAEALTKIEDLEKRSRRENLCLKDLSKEAYAGLFSTLLGDDHPEVHLDRAHAVGLAGGSCQRPRDVLVKLRHFTEKKRF